MKRCITCEKRELCRKLCKDVEVYANQDQVVQREVPMALLERDVPNRMEGEQWDWVADQTYLTPREKEIVTLLGRGSSKWEVVELLNISKGALDKHIQRIRGKVLEDPARSN